jgi:hypothetical protein
MFHADVLIFQVVLTNTEILRRKLFYWNNFRPKNAAHGKKEPFLPL